MEKEVMKTAETEPQIRCIMPSEVNLNRMLKRLFASHIHIMDENQYKYKTGSIDFEFDTVNCSGTQ